MALRILVLILLAIPAYAHDGMHNDWMNSLIRPDIGGSCCNLTDCRVTEARMTGEGWVAQTQLGNWVKVPNEKIIRGKDNPTGRPVLCWLPSSGVLCFVEPPMG